MPTAQIYIKRNQAVTWDKFKKLCKANDWKNSEKIMEYVQKMVDAHGDGGSQTYLDFADNPKTLPLYKTCVKGSKDRYRGMFYCSQIGDYRLPIACTRCDLYREES
jgi:hypothetical protein